MPLALRYPRLWLLSGWTLVVLAIIVSVLPVHRLPHPSGVDDKVEHMVGYAVLSLWFAGIYPKSRYMIIAIGLFVMGVAIEWAQGAMHLGRQADVRDVVANTAGILSGLTLALVWLGGWAQRVEAWTKRR